MKKLKNQKDEEKIKKVTLLKEDVFKYVNITSFIQAWYKKNKKEYSEHFNFRLLAKKLGCRSTSEIFKIINKKKLPSREMINRFIVLMELSNNEAIYLILLSQFSGKSTKRKLKKEILTRYKKLVRKK